LLDLVVALCRIPHHGQATLEVCGLLACLVCLNPASLGSLDPVQEAGEGVEGGIPIRLS
jgi:hypothetical protein